MPKAGLRQLLRSPPEVELLRQHEIGPSHVALTALIPSPSCGDRSTEQPFHQTIDAQRHNIIHENGLGTPLPSLEDDLEYLRKTAWFLMGLVNKKYGLIIGMRQYFNLQTATPQEVAPQES